MKIDALKKYRMKKRASWWADPENAKKFEKALYFSLRMQTEKFLYLLP